MTLERAVENHVAGGRQRAAPDREPLRHGPYDLALGSVPGDEVTHMGRAVSLRLAGREHGQVERGWLGVSIQTVTADIAQGLDLEDEQGALVANVVPDSPAAKAGLRVGDVIMVFNGQQVKLMKDLPRLVANVKAGQQVAMEIWRRGAKQTLSTVIEATPGEKTTVAKLTDKAVQPEGKLGLTLAKLTPDLRQRYRLAEDTQGVLIVGVREDSPADEKGIRAGDVIRMVGQTAVENPQDIVHEVQQASAAQRNAILLLVERDEREQFIALRLV